MKHENFTMQAHGFVGHLAEPDGGSDRAVLVIMGGEQSMLPGKKIAERFADYGITGLAVSLFGAEGLPQGTDRIPLEMFRPAMDYLKQVKKITHISVYGQSMGSIFATLVAQYIGGVENLILVSPTHVPFEGTPDKKTMSGRSIATFGGQDVPFVPTDFGCKKAMRYYRHPGAAYPVTGMWIAFYNAYQDKAAEKTAWLHLEKTDARILLIAGGEDEMWPAEYSARAMQTYLAGLGYDKDVKVIVHPHGSHLTGMMPNRQREKMLYRLIPLIGLLYKAFGRHRRENMEYLSLSEREIIAWLK